MWGLFHAYNSLVRDGKVKPISCPSDNNPLVTMLNPWDRVDSVWLWCSFCDTIFQPGLDVINQVEAVVSEHYV